ncbi:interleukin-1 receptor type 2 isoform 2-T2 [Thomomys bottae]
MSTELRVFMNTKASLKLVSYVQMVTLSASGMLVCPDLRYFLPHRTDAKVRWYKDSVLLDENNKKFQSVGIGKRLIISNASMEDMGYFRCVLTFVLRGREYNVSRNIELLVKRNIQKKMRATLKYHCFLIRSQGRICIQILPVRSMVYRVIRYYIPQSKKPLPHSLGKLHWLHCLWSFWFWGECGYTDGVKAELKSIWSSHTKDSPKTFHPSHVQ